MANDFINQFPYTDFHELNLDWLIKKTKQLQADMTEVQETLAQIEILTEDQINAMISSAIEANNIILAQQFVALKNEITTEYKGYVTAQINALTTYVDNQDVFYNDIARGYSQTALEEAKEYTDSAVLTYTMMINPITGEYEDVRNVVEDIVEYFHTGDSLTASEYDALDLTAQTYDDYEISAYDYDFNAKTILIP